jgi:hypothetical protein
MKKLDELFKRHGVRADPPLRAHLEAMLGKTEGIGSVAPTDQQNLAATIDNLTRFLRGLRNQHKGEWHELSLALAPAKPSEMIVKDTSLANDLRKIIGSSRHSTLPPTELLRATLIFLRSGKKTRVFSIKRRFRENSLYALWMHQSVALNQPLRTKPAHFPVSSFVATWAVRRLPRRS